MWAFLLLPVLAAASPDHVNANKHHFTCQPASAQLSTIAPAVDFTNSDDNLQLELTVFNPNSVSVTILKRETPLEGILTNMFVVRSPEGKPMQYRGIDAKRAPQPSSSEYVIIAAGASITTVISLGNQYSFDSDGEYSISLSKHITGNCGSGKLPVDYSSAATTVTVRGAAAHELRYSEHMRSKHLKKTEESNPTRRTLQTDATHPCSTSQLSELANWQADAAQKINAAIDCTETSCTTLVDTWFGSSTTQSEFSAVTTVFTKMQSVYDESIYACPADGASDCAPNVFGYVYTADTTQTIYICQYTFDYPDYSEKVQTVIHELSHFDLIGATTDDVYGQTACYELAQTNPAAARECADSYGYFAIFTNVCYLHAPADYTPYAPPCNSCNGTTTGTTTLVCGPTSAPTSAPPTPAISMNSAAARLGVGHAICALLLGYLTVLALD